jgi:hypothetical protein
LAGDAVVVDTASLTNTPTCGAVNVSDNQGNTYYNSGAYFYTPAPTYGQDSEVATGVSAGPITVTITNNCSSGVAAITAIVSEYSGVTTGNPYDVASINGSSFSQPVNFSGEIVHVMTTNLSPSTGFPVFSQTGTYSKRGYIGLNGNAPSMQTWDFVAPTPGTYNNSFSATNISASSLNSIGLGLKP